MNALYEKLSELNIEYQQCEHPPVFTCAQARDLVPDLSGGAIKNLFLRDRKGKRHFLVVVDETANVDLAALSDTLEATRLSFASSERLEKHLGVQSGAVGPLALINDPEKAVTLVIDNAVWKHDDICCHPLVNTATLVLKRDDLKRFCEATGHDITFIDVPSK